MELSELEWFSGYFLTPGDHTGKLLELLSPRGLLDGRKSNHLVERSSKVPPSTLLKSILYDGSGDNKNQFQVGMDDGQG